MVKLTGIARLRPGASIDDLARHWQDVPAPEGAGELRGLIVAEVLRKVGGELDADAIVEAWWDGTASSWSGVAAHAAPGDTLWASEEDVYMSRAYPDAGSLRGGAGRGAGDARLVGTAKKRDDFTTEAFFDYWRNVHAPLGGKTPGLTSYVVSKLGQRIAGDVHADAIVSLWWPDEDSLNVGMASEETATAWQDVPNYAQTDGTFWVCRERVLVAPPATGPGSLDRG